MSLLLISVLATFWFSGMMRVKTVKTAACENPDSDGHNRRTKPLNPNHKLSDKKKKGLI
jgi:hypothetical protein